MRITKSTKEGWTKTGKGEYRHEAGHTVKKINCGWQVSGPDKNNGLVYGTMWAAMSAAAGTVAEFAR